MKNEALLPFIDRKDAGLKLAKALTKFSQSPNTTIIALPRGGVVIGYYIAKELQLPLDITCPRKIGAPFNPEFAIGAVTEMGHMIISSTVMQDLGLSNQEVAHLAEKEKKIALQRLQQYRGNRPSRQIEGKTVILVDDGLATGSTMRAAIETMRKEKVAKLILAVPVAPVDTLRNLSTVVDEVVCLATPATFHAVGQFYIHFDQTTDEEVMDLLNQVSKVI